MWNKIAKIENKISTWAERQSWAKRPRNGKYERKLEG